MSNYKLIDDKDVPDNVVIPEDNWAVKVGERVIVYEYIKFADEPNKDGTYTVEYKYDILEGVEPESEKELQELEQLLGDLAIQLVEEGEYAKQMKKALVDAEGKR